ncbi:MAG: ABC transporter ATP-binding protein [Bacillota bacterium]
MKQDLLRIKNIKKSFNDTIAVDSVSFKVKESEIFGLLGPNGAGKTTLIRIIMDIFKADQGEIIVGDDLKIDKSMIGYLPEERGIYEQTEVLETIIYFANLKGMAKSEAEQEALQWLKKFGLEDNATSKIETLSKGMKQKVQFIIAIVHQPVLLVLDELFSGLDPVNQKLFKKVIRDLAQQGVTVLLSSHQMNLVEELCNRIFMINDGHQVLYGDLEEIKNNFGGKRVMLSPQNDFEQSILESKSYIENLEVHNNRLTFNLGQNSSPSQLLTDLPAGIELAELSILNPPLYDIFINQVAGGGNNE